MSNQPPFPRREPHLSSGLARIVSLVCLILLMLFGLSALLTACSGFVQPLSTGRIPSDGGDAPSAAVDFVPAVEESAPPAEPSGGVNGEGSGPIASAGQSPVQQGTQRLIIKDGQMTIEVRQTDAAADQLMLITVDFGGYVIGQRIWTGAGGFRFANIQVAVPVSQFEAALRAFRTLGVVLDESASGQDVTDEFVDLNSRLGNLHATQMRLRTFLEQANTISETLRVHEELTAIEEEISLVQGRINYLQDRAAFSTITVNLQPIVPTPTPTPSPTPTPIPTAQSWRPGDTAKTALVQLQESGQSFFDFILYNGIVCGPWLLALAGLGYLGHRGLQRARRRSGL